MKIDSIFNQDCLLGLRNIEKNSIDLTVTSPPYDSIREYNNSSVWNFDVFKNIAYELYSVTKPGGVIVWVVADSTTNGSESCTSFKQALFFKENLGLSLYDTMIYRKKNPPPKTHRRYEQAFEYIFVFSKGRPKTFNPIMVPCKYEGKKTSSTFYQNSHSNLPSHKHNDKPVSASKQHENIWEYAVGREERGLNHPAVFPIKLAEDQILSWSNVGDLILDPFIGSGTTAIAAINTGRHYIGYEVDKEYFNICCKRIASKEERHDQQRSCKDYYYKYVLLR